MIQLINSSGASVWLTEIGAGIVSVIVPDRNGEMADVCLGYKERESYFNDGAFMGKTPGRYANRIACGRFELEGVEYHLAINNGPNHLHGGPKNFAEKEWDVVLETSDKVVFQYISVDGEENYPGELTVKVSYTWSDDNILSIELVAWTNKATIINLTNHSYWNLSGENAGSVLDHELELCSDHWLPTSDSLIPTGELAPVEGTPMDFRKAKTLGKDIKADFPALDYGKGYDNCWVLRKDDRELKIAAILTDRTSGRKMEVYTTQPGIQIYTGNGLNGSAISKSGRSYNDYDGVAIECQNFPDAPNKPHFPSAMLQPNQEYREIIQYKFGSL